MVTKKINLVFKWILTTFILALTGCSSGDDISSQHIKGDPMPIIIDKKSSSGRVASSCGGFYSGTRVGSGNYTYPDITIDVVLPGTNLIRNSSFETRKPGTNCPIGPWYDPNSTQGFPDIWGYGVLTDVLLEPGYYIIGTPDYLQACADINSGYNPNNHIVGAQTPRTGDSMGGIITSNAGTQGGTSSEYFIQEFQYPLLQGKSYNVEFYISLADDVKYACNGIGAYFTNNYNSLINSGEKSNYDQFTPQVPSSFPTSYITDKTGWTKISGTYTPSVSGVKWMVIGNFRPDNRLALSVPNPPLTDSYYYIDDVSVIELGSPGNISVYCNPYDVPNRFTLYNSAGISVATTNWIGTANYPGPWGLSLNNGSPKTISASTSGSSFFKLRIETSPPSNINDAWEASVGCN